MGDGLGVKLGMMGSLSCKQHLKDLLNTDVAISDAGKTWFTAMVSFYVPLMVLCLLLLIATFLTSNDWVGNSKLFKLDGRWWLLIIGILGVKTCFSVNIAAAAALSEASDLSTCQWFVELTFKNIFWYLYMVAYVFSILLGTGAIALRSPDQDADADLKVPVEV